MPKLNYDKLPYKKTISGIKAPKTNSFYEPIQCDDEIHKKIYRGYHTYNYFGKIVRRHEETQNEEIQMTYEEKRELRLQISQLLANAGLNQKVIKDMVETEIKNKVDRAVEQCMNSLNSECSSNNYIKDLVIKYTGSYFGTRRVEEAVKEELKNKVIQVVLKDCEGE